MHHQPPSPSALSLAPHPVLPIAISPSPSHSFAHRPVAPSSHSKSSPALPPPRMCFRRVSTAISPARLPVPGRVRKALRLPDPGSLLGSRRSSRRAYLLSHPITHDNVMRLCTLYLLLPQHSRLCV
ncbi:hypothetical protein C8Q80DRAFT_392924 [Daedaleopsis nitida]|nr:hypothetical protein C8Q80DRAFT_392924 [Daedaleopsis nitida]